MLPPYYPSGARCAACCKRGLTLIGRRACAATEAELEDWALYAANVRRLMAERLGVPLVEQASSVPFPAVHERTNCMAC